MTTRTTARGTRTARKRAAAPAQKRAAAQKRAPAAGAATEQRAPAAARRGRAAGTATQERRQQPRKRATTAQKRQPVARRELEPAEPIPQLLAVARRDRAAAPPEPPPQPVRLTQRAAEQKRTGAAPSPNGGREVRLPVIGARIPLPPPSTGPLGPAHVLWLGGLVGGAALGVIEWPVAAALAAGTWVIERFAKATVREELRHAGERRE